MEEVLLTIAVKKNIEVDQRKILTKSFFDRVAFFRRVSVSEPGERC